ncbi:MAG: chemotaxis protein CheW [Gemmatimonadota bacterium]
MTDAIDQVRDRPLDDEALDAATAHYARARTRDDIAMSSVFVFRIGTEWLGLPTAALDRVEAPSLVHSLPHRRGVSGAGLVNVGGDLIVHVLLSGLLGIQRNADTGAHAGRRVSPRLVVMRDSRGRLAMTVDEVWGVHHYDPALLRAAPPTLTRAPTSYTTAMLEVDGRTVGILDATQVLDALSTAIA